MSFLPIVENGKFSLKQAFQGGKILAFTKKFETCVTSTLKLIEMMLKCLCSASLFHMHALLESDYSILRYILHFFALCRSTRGE